LWTVWLLSARTVTPQHYTLTDQLIFAFEEATLRLESAAEALLLKENYSPECEKDLAALGTSIEKFKDSIGSTIFMEGTKSKELMADLYSSTPAAASAKVELGNLTVGQKFKNEPGTTAVAELSGNLIFIDPQKIGKNLQQNMGLFFHEKLHNLTGLTDDVIQDKLGLTVDSNNSKNISDKLVKDCINK